MFLKIHCSLSTLSSKPEIWSFYVDVLTSTGEKCTKLRATRSFFPLLTNNISAAWRCRSRSRRRFLNSLVQVRLQVNVSSQLKQPKPLLMLTLGIKK